MENVIKKYLNSKGVYCSRKSEEVREQYKFERQVKPELEKRIQKKANSVYSADTYIIINGQAL